MRDPVPRRVVVRSLLRSAAATVLLVLAYYVLPLDGGLGAALAWLVLGPAAVAAVLVWQLRAIVAAAHPRLRAFNALAVGLPMLLVVFAATYLLLAENNSESFSQPLDRTGALYFAVTVLATVGFGDIAPVTSTARSVTMVQMLLDLVAFGLAAKVVVEAVDEGLSRRSGGDTEPR